MIPGAGCRNMEKSRPNRDSVDQFMNATDPTSESAARDREAEAEAFIAARRAPSMPPAGSGASAQSGSGPSETAGDTSGFRTADSEHESAAQALRAPGVEIEEQHYRSVLKAVSWRVTGTLDTMLISYLVTGNLAAAASIGFLEVFTKMGLYYGHERIWSRLKFGRKVKEIPPPDYQI